MRSIVLVLLLAVGVPAYAQSYTGPIIDVHLHVGHAAPGAPNPATGQPTTANTDAEREHLTLEQLQRHNVCGPGQWPGCGNGEHAQPWRRPDLGGGFPRR